MFGRVAPNRTYQYGPRRRLTGRVFGRRAGYRRPPPGHRNVRDPGDYVGDASHHETISARVLRCDRQRSGGTGPPRTLPGGPWRRATYAADTVYSHLLTKRRCGVSGDDATPPHACASAGAGRSDPRRCRSRRRAGVECRREFHQRRPQALPLLPEGRLLGDRPRARLQGDGEFPEPGLDDSIDGSERWWDFR